MAKTISNSTINLELMEINLEQMQTGSMGSVLVIVFVLSFRNCVLQRMKVKIQGYRKRKSWHLKLDKWKLRVNVRSCERTSVSDFRICTCPDTSVLSNSICGKSVVFGCVATVEIA